MYIKIFRRCYVTSVARLRVGVSGKAPFSRSTAAYKSYVRIDRLNGNAARRVKAQSKPYWQASQSGLSMLQALGTGAAVGAASTISVTVAFTAFSAPSEIVDFSAAVAPMARR